MALAPEQAGIGIRRHFTTEGVHPYDELTWERRDARITNWQDGSVAFEQLGVEFPSTWSVNATNIVAQKYFRGTPGTAERESSLRQVIDRVADTIARWGVEGGYFVDDAEAATFNAELKHLLVTQKAAFNSPVWFNIGVDGVPQQASACFILSVDDTMDSILNWYVEEGTIFKGGSGSGINLSRIRSSAEHLKGGGTASGPVSFMRGADASAGTIKCLRADTPIRTIRGVVPIAQVRAGDQVATRHGYQPVTAVHDNGERPLVRLATSLGDELHCTPEHRFWVRGADGEGWREAGKLRSDDWIALDLDTPRHGALVELHAPDPGHDRDEVHRLPTHLDELFAMWLGWVWGDGSMPSRPNAQFVSTQIGDDSPELVTRFEQVTRGVFGETIHLCESRHEDEPDASRSVRFSSSQVLRFLEVNGLWKPKTDALSIPVAVQSSPGRVRAAFLAGLFEADGHVGNGYARYSTASRTLALDVHRLLLSIGIPSTIGRIDDRCSAFGTRPVHTVRVVGGEGMRRFAKVVGAVSERKHAALAAAVERESASPYETQWVLPHVAAELDAVWRSATDPRLRRALSPYCRTARPRAMSLQRARALLDRFPDELGSTSLARFAAGDELYVTATVEPAGTGPTFDLTVRDVHEYLVNGLVTHNSGGKTRRAAKMVILDADHPDVEEFIWVKAREEQKIRVLEEAGFDMTLDGRDMASVQYQNANNSVRVTDEFMQAVVDDADWHLRAVTSGEIVKTVRARDLMRQISQAAWECADPGMQFDTTINRWHTAADTGRINASNPCSEYMHLDNSACNLASLNLLKFLELSEDGASDRFDVEGFRHAVEVVFTGQEILVGRADYPTEAIGDTSRRFRQLGIGYANLGALLMALGLPYDSDEGRAYAAAITSLMTGHAYATSARTAVRMGPFAGYAENEEHMLRVLDQHRAAAAEIDEEVVPAELMSAAQQCWDEARELAEEAGVRNSQASVLAPTGTIGLMMDCDTTGIEPDLGLCKVKKLVGGGTMQIVNQTVPRALRRLGYTPEQSDEIVAYIDEHKTILGAPHLASGHVPVFACSMGDNPIHYTGHVRMMAAVQPFISGAISKCVVGETLVPTTDGLVRIGSLHHGEAPDTFRHEIVEVASLNGPQKTDAFYYGGERAVRSAVLRSGHRVVGTPNHRLLVGGPSGVEWKRLDEIEVGDHVAVQYGSELWSTTLARVDGFAASRGGGRHDDITVPAEMTDELAWLLGAYAAAGHVGASDAAVTISSADAGVLDRAVAAFRDLFGLDATVGSGEGCCPQVVVSSRSLVELLDHLGCGRRAPDKRFPDAVLRSPRSVVLSFLQGLSLDAHAVSEGSAKWAIRLDSAGLLDDLQAVLTNLGIVHSRTSTSGSGSGTSSGEVYATGRQAQRLVDLVPFSERDKAAWARELLTRVTADRHATADLVPIAPRDLYDCLPRARSGRNGHSVRAEFAYLCDPRASSVTRETLQRVASVPGVRLPMWLRQVLDDGLHFSPVESVGGAGHREVFDVSVPATHAFVGNGIVNHNTVNMPEDVTIEEVEQLHIDAWRMGVKAIAIYRDNCKVAQPLATAKRATAADPAEAVTEVVEKVVEKVIQVPVREKLPRNRVSRTFEFRVADCKGFVTVGEYEDGRPGEIFLRISKQGSTLAGIMDAFAISVSYGLQYGVPLRAYVETLTNTRFEPAGMTDDPDLRFASSLIDYIFRRLALQYLSYEERAELGILTVGERTQPTLPGVEESVTETVQGHDIPADPPSLDSSSPLLQEFGDAPREPSLLDRAGVTDPAPPTPSAAISPTAKHSDAPMCMQCGVQMQRAGSCHACPSCGSTSGCS